MKTNLIFSLCYVMSFMVFATGQRSKPGKFKCDKATMDSCAAKLIMFADKDFVYPTDLNSMNKRCKELRPLERCIKDYAKNCLSLSSSQGISVIAFSIARTNRNYCTNEKRKNKMIAFGQCANRNQQYIYDVLLEMNRKMHGVKTYKDKKLRLPMNCCLYFKFKDLVMERINADCTYSEAMEVQRVIEGYAYDGLNLLCGDYTEDSDKCRHLLTKVPKWTKPLEWKVFLNVLVDILDSLD